eukprot:gnl/Spiro4/17929_TR9556_c0_g1_i1.p1 gnl/Spiro4/17929_TR9556_c0_g1~~gnl/Spiro4/17929_TR9556_c0_g1_i1.p1  ORF type:complete len:228 (+),score=36.22 gnl/Spiro4/17929_TR9556_c0_g1_i1:31-684(+)
MRGAPPNFPFPRPVFVPPPAMPGMPLPPPGSGFLPHMHAPSHPFPNASPQQYHQQQQRQGFPPSQNFQQTMSPPHHFNHNTSQGMKRPMHNSGSNDNNTKFFRGGAGRGRGGGNRGGHASAASGNIEQYFNTSFLEDPWAPLLMRLRGPSTPAPPPVPTPTPAQMTPVLPVAPALPAPPVPNMNIQPMTAPPMNNVPSRSDGPSRPRLQLPAPVRGG